MPHTSIKLSKATIKAQQKLSNRFGIPTFNKSGGISTVPTSGKINSKINVGRGSFKSNKTFTVAINRRISEVQNKKNTQQANRKKSGSVKKIFSTKKSSSVFNNKVITAPSKKTVSVPKILSKSTLQAQQDLSNRFGIPTFTLKGGISTVPTSGVFNDINVGFGKFKDEDSFVDAVVDKFNRPTVPQPFSGGGSSITDSITNFFTSLFQSEPQDVTTGLTTEPTGLTDESSQTIQDEFLFGGSGGQSGDIQSTSENDDESFFDGILNNPIKLGLGIILLTAVLFAVNSTGGKKKRRR